MGNEILYRELMWINEEQGYIAFDVKNSKTGLHEYYEYIKFVKKDASDGN